MADTYTYPLRPRRVLGACIAALSIPAAFLGASILLLEAIGTRDVAELFNWGVGLSAVGLLGVPMFRRVCQMKAAPMAEMGRSRKPTFPLKRWRVLLGLLLAPFVTVLLWVLGLQVRASAGLLGLFDDVFDSLRELALSTVLTAPVLVILSVPAVWVFRRRSWDSWWNYSLAGWAVGAIGLPTALIQNAPYDYDFVGATLAVHAVSGGVGGAVAGLVLWFVLYLGLERTRRPCASSVEKA